MKMRACVNIVNVDMEVEKKNNFMPHYLYFMNGNKNIYL